MEIPQEPMSPAEALAWFDGLGPVAVDELVGRWDGRELRTGHRLSGLLERGGWVGKAFASASEVDPLLLTDGRGGGFAVDPRWVPVELVARLPRPLVSLGGRIVPLLRPVVAARGPRGRLTTVSHRGVPTAALVYDHLPVLDVFRRVDVETVVGLMERRGEPEPLFFLLTCRR